MSRVFLTRGACVVALNALLFAACGGGESLDVGSLEDDGLSLSDDSAIGGSDDGATDGGDSGSGGSGTEADLEQTAIDSFMAFVTSDDQAHFALMSRECRENLQFSTVQAHLDGRRFVAGGAGVDVRDLAVDRVEISGFTGSSADVSLTLTGTVETFRETIPRPWVFEEGGWRLADCSDVTEARGGLAGAGSDRSEPLPYGGVADVNGWLVALTWIDADAGDLMAEVGSEPPAAGNQLFNAQVNLSYNGAEQSVTVGDEIEFAMVNGSTVYGAESSCETDNTVFLDSGLQLGPGDSAGIPLICREISSGDVDGLLLRITHLSTGDEYWFDLTEV